MCGRFHQSTAAADIARAFKINGPPPNIRPRWNAAPTAGKIISRVAPMLGLVPRLDLPPADQLILAGAKQAAR